MSEDKMEELTEERKEYWRKLFAESEKKSRRIKPIKRNQLSLWLGRLIIAYNTLENALANTLTMELVDLLGKDEPPPKTQLAYIPPSLERAWNVGLNDIIMATMPFKQKLDFLAALLIKRFSDNSEHQKQIVQIVSLLYATDEFRNKMVHSVWQQPHIEFSRVKVTTKGRKGLKIAREDANMKQLRTAIEIIQFLEELGLYVLRTPDVDMQSNIDYTKLITMLQTASGAKSPANGFVTSGK